LFAHWVAVVANDENDVSTIAFVPRDTKGITTVDDWSGFGRRTTGSGTTLLDNVEVHPFAILSFAALFERPTSMGPFAQIMHAAVGRASPRPRSTTRSSLSAIPSVPPRTRMSTG
jgi:alkylation response protein AidB-like acyl-CoA dehydrogenase